MGTAGAGHGAELLLLLPVSCTVNAVGTGDNAAMICPAERRAERGQRANFSATGWVPTRVLWDVKPSKSAERGDFG